jgi:hypothetical protein
MLCELDIEKAYEHVNYEFLLYLLRKCSFGEKWRTWIEHSISLVHLSVLVNDTPSGFFSSSHSLRQRNLFSFAVCHWHGGSK